MPLKMTGFNLFEEELKKYENPDEIAAKAVDAAAPVLAGTVKDLIKATTSADSTGELAESIKPTEARMNGYGCFAAVRPVGTDSKGVRNA